ncbi:hypothetical protein C8F04DRAFT_1368752 [Mycena alexandri]|uniref:Uncharacterized protein n=1 Tax=Mycena alexandri TaxID=1745969 RepID=A0AAD6SLL0_9AGAR|nr:hypothetical protein C8F04DRAFT_1368752 [Mycena alexandri]
MHSHRFLLAVVVLHTLFFTSANGNSVNANTNAVRLRRGLPPLPPRNLFKPTAVRRDDPTPSPTFCSQIGSVNLPLELRYQSDDSLIGYIGPSQSSGSGGLYNVVFAGFGGSNPKQDRTNLGTLFSVEYDSPYNAITIAGSEPTAWCAEVNQWQVNRTGYTVDAHSSQDLTHTDTYYNPEPQNFLFNLQCNSGGGFYQRANYAWDDTGLISLEWLEGPDGSTYDTFPTPWYRPSTGLFRWYQQGYSPTLSRSNGRDWAPAYVRWSCTVDPPDQGGDASAAAPEG